MLDVTSKSTRFTKELIPGTAKFFSGDESMLSTRKRSTEAAKACCSISSIPDTFWKRIMVNDLSAKMLAPMLPSCECFTTTCHSSFWGKDDSNIFLNWSTLRRLEQAIETTVFSD